jgi:hypothetical protein
MHPQISYVKSTGVGVAVMANEGETSYFLNSILSGYVFDYFSGRENLDAYYTNKLTEYSERVASYRVKTMNKLTQMADKPWELDLPQAGYEGEYTSELFGTLVVDHLAEGSFIIEIGNLKSRMVTGHRTNAMRVQMGSSGSVVQFGITDNAVETATWKGQVFTKTRE